MRSLKKLFCSALLHNLTQLRNLMIKLYTMTAVLALMASSAMAGPDIDMSRIITTGTFNTDISSTATAGAAIQGAGPGVVSVAVEANNWAKGNGSFEVNVDSDTNNSGPGVGGFSTGDIAVDMDTRVGGAGRADTSGDAVKKGIQTAIVSFGSATVGFDGAFAVRMATDDWN
jgi:hypothetical protein